VWVQTLPCNLDYPEKFFAANYFVTSEFSDLDESTHSMLDALFQQVRVVLGGSKRGTRARYQAATWWRKGVSTRVESDGGGGSGGDAGHQGR